MTFIESQLRALGIDPARCTIGPPVGKLTAATGKHQVASKCGPKADRMNKTERAYAVELAALQQAGEILRWRFEALTLLLVDPSDTGGRGVRYTPDFAIWTPDRLCFVEIKGFLRDDAKLKFLWARQQFPEWEFKMLQRKGGQWIELLAPTCLPAGRPK